jgi:hypothetical protein
MRASALWQISVKGRLGRSTEWQSASSRAQARSRVAERSPASDEGPLIAVSVTPTHGFSTGSSERLFNIPGVSPEWAVSQDGQRFLFAVPTAPPASYIVVVNWQSMLPR